MRACLLWQVTEDLHSKLHTHPRSHLDIEIVARVDAGFQNCKMSRASTPLNDPRYDSRWKMPGYTGHVNGVVETLGSTPVTAQVC